MPLPFHGSSAPSDIISLSDSPSSCVERILPVSSGIHSFGSSCLPTAGEKRSTTCPNWICPVAPDAEYIENLPISLEELSPFDPSTTFKEDHALSLFLDSKALPSSILGCAPTADSLFMGNTILDLDMDEGITKHQLPLQTKVDLKTTMSVAIAIYHTGMGGELISGQIVIKLQEADSLDPNLTISCKHLLVPDYFWSTPNLNIFKNNYLKAQFEWEEGIMDDALLWRGRSSSRKFALRSQIRTLCLRAYEAYVEQFEAYGSFLDMSWDSHNDE